jgi:hypothetical protein
MHVSGHQMERKRTLESLDTPEDIEKWKEARRFSFSPAFKH